MSNSTSRTSFSLSSSLTSSAADEQLGFCGLVAAATADRASEDGIETKQSKLEISWYGNFGGPGHGSADKTPIDKLDEAFKRHDEGYGKNGYFDFGTDVALMGDMLERLANGSPKERLWAGITTGLFLGVVAPLSLEVTSTRKTVQAAEWTRDRVVPGLNTAVSVGEDVVTMAARGARSGIGSVANGAVAVGNGVVGAVGGFFGGLF